MENFLKLLLNLYFQVYHGYVFCEMFKKEVLSGKVLFLVYYRGILFRTFYNNKRNNGRVSYLWNKEKLGYMMWNGRTWGRALAVKYKLRIELSQWQL